MKKEKMEKMEKKLKKLSVLVRDLEDKLHSHADWIHHAARENAELKGKVQDLEGKLMAKASKVDLQVFQNNTEEDLKALMERKADKPDVEGLAFLVDKTRKGLENEIKVATDNKVGKELLDAFADGVKVGHDGLQNQINDLKNKVDNQVNPDGITRIGSGIGKTTTINGGTINCNKPIIFDDIERTPMIIPEGKELVSVGVGWELRNKPTQWQVAPEDLQGWKTTRDYAQQFLDRADGKVFTNEEKEQTEKLAESIKWVMQLNEKYEGNIGGGINLNALALHSSRIILDMMNRMDNTVQQLEKLERDFDDEIGHVNL